MRFSMRFSVGDVLGGCNSKDLIGCINLRNVYEDTCIQVFKAVVKLYAGFLVLISMVAANNPNWM